ncbi:hypothetical protein [Radiobacillus sp. PE A8.2]|uniref:hypothetical protein n=1 Tax=Radiobacillus sp. PE A8.2 TaxID=3380349 RepID=UPI0038908D8D
MTELNVSKLQIEHVSVNTASEFNGFHIKFLVDNQLFQFLVGQGTSLIPFGIKHVFTEKQACQICNKTINAVPIGQQICSVLQSHREALLSYFKTNYADLLQH